MAAQLSVADLKGNVEDAEVLISSLANLFPDKADVLNEVKAFLADIQAHPLILDLLLASLDLLKKVPQQRR